MSGLVEISVIICTHDRAKSLADTLECLARADRANLRTEIIVVENGNRTGAKAVAESFSERLSVRYLFEPTVGIYGKSHALNRALDSGGLGEIIVVLDDDMSPHPDWFKGIAESCKKYPNADVFSGRSYVVWPDERSPAWARHPSVMGWGFSVADQGDCYKPLPPGATFSGNHFWFRSRVLGPDRRFSDMWLTEPDFILRLTEEGRQGIWAPGAIAGHRIQPDLVDKKSAQQRALMIGRAIGELRFAAHRNNRKIVKFRKHPRLGRVFCVAKLIFWSGFSAGAHFWLDADTRFSLGLVALERKTAYAEMLRRT